MQRRSFLSMFGAAAIAPALPAIGAAAPAAGYNRFVYGLAVFHTRKTGVASTTELMARLKLSSVQADSIITEMATSGVVQSSPMGGGAMQAVQKYSYTNPHQRLTAGRKISETLGEQTRSPTLPKIGQPIEACANCTPANVGFLLPDQFDCATARVDCAQASIQGSQS